MNKENWFVDWFDSDHYHTLYQHRNYVEAERFISNLFRHLNLPNDAEVIDLACGKGRHALQVHELGYKVLGVDLSEESIDFAKKFESEKLHFMRADMRNLGLNHAADLVLNLFTSFGYFQKEGENRKVLASISNALKPHGKLVLDYLNVSKVIPLLPQQELIKRGNIDFKINKRLQEKFIAKDIEFEQNNKSYHFQEFVKCIDLQLFQRYFESVGMQIIETFGDYDLNQFDETTSDRLIMIVEKQ